MFYSVSQARLYDAVEEKASYLESVGFGIVRTSQHSAVCLLIFVCTREADGASREDVMGRPDV